MKTNHHIHLSESEVQEHKLNWELKLNAMRKQVAELQAEAQRRNTHVDQVQSVVFECAELDTSIRYFVNKMQFDHFKMAVPIREMQSTFHPASLNDVQLWHEFHDILVKYRVVNSSLEHLIE